MNSSWYFAEDDEDGIGNENSSTLSYGDVSASSDYKIN